MKRALICTFATILIISAVTFSQTNSTTSSPVKNPGDLLQPGELLSRLPQGPPPPPPEECWTGILIENDEGFPELKNFDEAATRHLNNAEPSFRDFKPKYKTVMFRRTNEIAIVYSAGLGKESFRVCMDRNLKVIGVQKYVSTDFFMNGDPSVVSKPLPTLCE